MLWEDLQRLEAFSKDTGNPSDELARAAGLAALEYGMGLASVNWRGGPWGSSRWARQVAAFRSDRGHDRMGMLAYQGLRGSALRRHSARRSEDQEGEEALTPSRVDIEELD